MTISMYQASVPVFIRTLTNMSAVLDKAIASAESRKIDPSVFIQARLAPDMLALPKQVQIATDIAKGCTARLAGVDVPSYEDNEATFPELKARLAKTIEFLKAIPADKVDGTEAKEVILNIRGGKLKFTGQDYLLGFAIPNIFFHATTLYAILRHNGVELGKMDFLGPK